MKLGRRAVKTDSRTLRLARYFTTALALAPPPNYKDWTKGIKDWGMMKNNELGCCTISGIGHAIQVFSANAGIEATVTDDTIVEYYSKWNGYNPADLSTDRGGIELDVLNHWKNTPFCGHSLYAFADVSPSHNPSIKQAINLFGGQYIGVSLPLSAQEQVGKTWDVVSNSYLSAPGSWGGHCVFVPQYDVDGLTCITWGKLQRMTWRFWNKYVDESHTLLSPDFVSANGLDPSGFNLSALQADLNQIY